MATPRKWTPVPGAAVANVQDDPSSVLYPNFPLLPTATKLPEPFDSKAFKATYLNGDNGSEIGGYILEFNDNVYNCDPGTPLGCVNYYQTKQIVTNDPSYTNPNMVNLCYIPPD